MKDYGGKAPAILITSPPDNPPEEVVKWLSKLNQASWWNSLRRRR